MTNLRSCAVAAALLTGAAGAAIPAAADGPPRYYGPSSLWQGAYVGAHLGYGESEPAEGVVGGAHIGYNWKNGQFVYGVEADASLADITYEESVPGASLELSVDWMATARGRVGILLQPELLAYATAGVGVAHAEGTLSIAGVGTGHASTTETDLVYGVGVEGKLSEKSAWRVEYIGFSDLEIDVIRGGLSFKLGQ